MNKFICVEKGVCVVVFFDIFARFEIHWPNSIGASTDYFTGFFMSFWTGRKNRTHVTKIKSSAKL
jgi:hypothetical protein